jgi:predicted Fe-Mo cluster-binding NifX family protein
VVLQAQLARLARQLCLRTLMRVAIPQWQGRVSPVFDVAANLLLIEIDHRREIGRQEIALTTTDPTRRARQVAQLPADVLICGAISWPLELALRSSGVRVIPQICGQVDEVVRSFLLGDLAKDAFRMPGCCGRRRFRGGQGSGWPLEDEQTQTSERRPRRMRRNRKEI